MLILAMCFERSSMPLDCPSTLKQVGIKEDFLDELAQEFLNESCEDQPAKTQDKRGCA
jgi:hypothetical protein